MTTPTDIYPFPSVESSGDSPVPHRPRRRRVRVVVLLAVVVIAVVGLAVVGVAVWPRHHHAPAASAGPGLPTSRPLLSGGAGEMLALLKIGQSATFHATFHAANVPGNLDFEVWQGPPRLREDTVRTADGHTDRTATIADNKNTTFCTQHDSAAWSCHPVPNSTSVGIAAIEATVAAATTGQSVAVSDTTMAGRKVRCFDVGAGPDALKLCATLNGIPVLVSNATVRYELATLDSRVPASSFTAPK
jgi:hypothetical protein